MVTCRKVRAPEARRGSGGFTLVELVVALTLLSTMTLLIFHAFIGGMAHAGRANERMAATTIGVQIIEQVRASVNPYTMVGFSDLARTALPLPAPYAGVANASPHPFEVAVDLTPDSNLTVIMVTVDIYRPTDATPFVTMTTMLDDH